MCCRVAKAGRNIGLLPVAVRSFVVASQGVSRIGILDVAQPPSAVGRGCCEQDHSRGRLCHIKRGINRKNGTSGGW